MSVLTVSEPFVTKTIIHPYSQGVLDGLSFAIKDNIDVKNQPTSYGSPGWIETHDKPVVNAICLEQLLCEGGIFTGKTKLDELAYSLMGINSFYGTPLNPKAPDRVPGGSSSGSASAVASGLVDFSLGTDTGGSVRVPASNCGVWGLRPTHGAISVAGVLPLAPSFDTVGLFAQNGQILETVMSVLYAEAATTLHGAPSICFIDDVFQLCDKQIIQATETVRNKIIDTYQSQTLTLSELADFNINLSELFLPLGALLSTEIWNTLGAWVHEKQPKLSADVKFSLYHYAESASRNDIQRNLVIKKTLQNNLNTFLCDGKVLCFPTTIDFAPRLADMTASFLAGDYVPRAMSVNAISCLSGTPQITIPIASVFGIPVGLSFIAACGQDMRLVNICNTIFDQCVLNCR